jgi:hypothetical protein
VGKLLTNSCAISLVELLNFLEESRRLRDKSAFDQKRLNVFELVLFGECRDIGEQFSLRNADKWVANPARVSLRNSRRVECLTLPQHWQSAERRSFCGWFREPRGGAPGARRSRLDWEG